MIFWILYVVGLAAFVWTVEFTCSTLESGAGSLAGFLENWKRFGDRLIVPIGETIETVDVRLSFLQRFIVSLRAIPLSHFARSSPVEPSQSVSSANSGEANT
jgi:hypothetical protein